MKLYAKKRGEGQLTVLALLETIVMTSIAIFVIIKTKTAFFVLFSSIISLLFFLRTTKSISFSIKLFEKVEAVFDAEVLAEVTFSIFKFAMIICNYLFYIFVLVVLFGWVPDLIKGNIGFGFSVLFNLIGVLLLIILVVILVGVICSALLSVLVAVGFFSVNFCIRSISTIYGLVFNTRETLLSIPKNWQKFTFSIDSTTTPEIIPGINISEKIKKNYNFFDFSKEFLSSAREGLEDTESDSGLDFFPMNIIYWVAGVLYSFIIYLCLFTLIYVPTFLVRFSIKSVVIFYLPFLYLAVSVVI